MTAQSAHFKSDTCDVGAHSKKKTRDGGSTPGVAVAGRKAGRRRATWRGPALLCLGFSSTEATHDVPYGREGAKQTQ